MLFREHNVFKRRAFLFTHPVGSTIKDGGDSFQQLLLLETRLYIQLTAVWKSADISRELKVVLGKSLI